MIEIKKIYESEIENIQFIAKNTWHTTYGHILSNDQSAYMLEMMYSKSSLTNQIKKHVFIGAYENDSIVGFVSFEPNFDDTELTKIHKIYILPNQQGKGIGNILINETEKISRENNGKGLILNVNRNNKAKDFYIKNGFEILKTEDIEIGNGYLMEDYVLQKLY